MECICVCPGSKISFDTMLSNPLCACQLFFWYFLYVYSFFFKKNLFYNDKLLDLEMHYYVLFNLKSNFNISSLLKRIYAQKVKSAFNVLVVFCGWKRLIFFKFYMRLNKKKSTYFLGIKKYLIIKDIQNAHIFIYVCL